MSQREEADLHDAFFDHTPWPLCELSSEGHVVRANSALLQLLGYASDELRGRPLSMLLHESETEPLLDLGAVQRDALVTFARTLQRRDGRPVRLLWSARATPHGSLSCAVQSAEAPADPRATLTPLDAQAHLRASLVQAERMASLGTLAAGIAHELNNPLTYVALNIDFVTHELASLMRAMEPQSPTAPEHDTGRLLDLRACAERAAEALRVAKAGTERASLIVRNLRTFASADDALHAPIDVRRVLDSSISVCWNEIRHRAKLVKDFSETALVVGNEAQLGHVFLNLLMNAVQAIPEGNTQRSEIRVTLRQAQGRVLVEIRDTGLGIAPAIIGRIFDPFFTTRPVGVSTGLGLSICHGIISRMGGEISVESALGKGSLFRVSLPAHSQDAQVSDAPPSTPSTARPRVLIIDDEPLVSASIARALEGELEVRCVDSGEEALALLLSDQRYDVVLCDLMMPDIAGMDVFEAVKKARPGVEERFVMMTGGAFTKRARDFLEAVPNRCLDKPLDVAEIRRLVHELRPKTRKGLASA